MIMPIDPEQLASDQITLTDTDALVYEAIATLEFTGADVRVPVIAESSGLDDDAVRGADPARHGRGEAGQR
jgi:hypothetical protein